MNPYTPADPADVRMQLWSYSAYLVISVAMTIWVARTLYRGGRIFLVDAVHGNEPLADSINRLLVVGFYLINLGYITLNMTERGRVRDGREAVEALSQKLGIVLLVLGGMHFFNLFLISTARRRSLGTHPPARHVFVPGAVPAPVNGPLKA